MNIRKEGVQRKIFVVFAAFAAAMVLVFGGVTAGYLLVNEVRETKESLMTDLTAISDQFERQTRTVYQIGKTVSENREIQKALKRPSGSMEERYWNDIFFSSELLYISKYFDENISVYVLGENGSLFKSGYLSFCQENYSGEEWYQTIRREKDVTWFDIHMGSRVAVSPENQYISMGIPMNDLETNRFLGVVLVELKVDDIFAEYGKDRKEKLYMMHADHEMVIEDSRVKFYGAEKLVDMNGGIQVYEDKKDCPAYMQETAGQIRYWQRDFPSQSSFGTMGYYASYARMKTTEWILVYVIRKRELYEGVILTAVLSLLAMMGMLAATLRFSFFVSDSLTKPIRLLRESAAEIALGNLEVQVPRVSNDEIGELSDQFNRMVGSLKELLKRVYEEQEKQRAYELMLLQAQINPHFLYNTLGSLQWLIRMNQLAAAEKMTTALTHFFKTGLNNGKDIIRLREELENVESYLTIQQLRYKSKLTFFVYMEKDVEELEVPKLILQPLVENALYHGIKPKEEGGFIDIHICKEEGRVHISVADDGCGMDRLLLESLREGISKGEVSRGDSYGLKNVDERLRLFFKGSYDMKIESSPGLGTSVNIYFNVSKAGSKTADRRQNVQNSDCG